jgi:hypothetical protein
VKKTELKKVIREIINEINSDLPGELVSVRPWEYNGKKRYYFKSGYLQKANAFFSFKKDKDKYEWKVDNGYVYAKKVYNGAVKEDLEKIFNKVESNF